MVHLVLEYLIKSLPKMMSQSRTEKRKSDLGYGFSNWLCNLSHEPKKNNVGKYLHNEKIKIHPECISKLDQFSLFSNFVKQLGLKA